MHYATVMKEFKLEAAHQIPNHPGKCRNLHGHTYIIQVYAFGPINPDTGMVVDFFDMKKHANEAIYDKCDHKNLNDVYPEMITTAENLAHRWLDDMRAQDSSYNRLRVYEGGDRGSYAEAVTTW